MPKIQGEKKSLKVVSTFKEHLERWKDCSECELSSKRHKIVLLKGKVPCDILFIGEAPGTSENLLGYPFAGPAGHLLDQIIKESIPESYRLAFTNLIACIPLGEDGDKVQEPKREWIQACQSRLIEVVRLCKPKKIVNVGQLSRKHVYGQAMFGGCEWLSENEFIHFQDIIHPAAILRADEVSKNHHYQRTIAQLSNLVEYDPPF